MFCQQILQTPLPPELLDPKKVPVESKKEHDDWLVVYNPEMQKMLDVDLMHTLVHSRCRFFISTERLLER
jgi:hypothetical protein